MKVIYNNYAHSGATITVQAQHDILNQVDNLDKHTELVLLTAGGNDVKFSTIAKSCFAMMMRSPEKCKAAVDEAFSLLPTVKQNTLALFNKLEQQIASDKQAQAVLLAYPLLSMDKPTYVAKDGIGGWYDGAYPAATAVRGLGIPAVTRKIDKNAPHMDVALVLDATGSMKDDIEAVRDNINNIIDKVRGKSETVRVTVVTYKDFPQHYGAETDYPAQVKQAFTEDINTVKDKIDKIVVSGGGDNPETVYSGLNAAFTQLKWRDGVKKGALVYSDAVPKDPARNQFYVEGYGR